MHDATRMGLDSSKLGRGSAQQHDPPLDNEMGEGMPPKSSGGPDEGKVGSVEIRAQIGGGIGR